MLNALQPSDIQRIRKTLPDKRGSIEKYLFIMDSLQVCDVSQNQEFQKKFNGFYRVRQRPESFYKAYYSYMQAYKNDDISFEDVLTYMHKHTGQIHASFSSKLLATINPNMPVWDSHVLSQLGIKSPGYYKKDRFAATVKTYEVLKGWYESYLKTQNARDVIDTFNTIYPTFLITDTKKIDLALWSLGVKD